ACFGVEAIDVPVGRAYHHVIFPHCRGRVHLATGLEAPYLTARLRIERIDLPGGIGRDYELLIGSQSGTAIAIILERPCLPHGCVPGVHVVARAIVIAAL